MRASKTKSFTVKRWQTNWTTNKKITKIIVRTEVCKPPVCKLARKVGKYVFMSKNLQPRA